jgi:transcriptional regulator
MNKPLGVLQGTLEMLALKAIAARGPVHGFEILEWIRRTTDDDLLVEDGALYPSLRRMEKRDWIESAWGVSEKGRRARYYTINAAGRKALAQEDLRWRRYVEAVAKLSRTEAP